MLSGTQAESKSNDAREVSDKASRLDRQEPLKPPHKTPIANRFIVPLIVLAVAALVYGLIYFREDTIPTGVGANLVPAERVLEGEVPYRDFYKIQTPGILLLNACLFKLFGATLITAFAGVLVFKSLTVMMAFLAARQVTTDGGAIVPALLTFVWLQPGGPFRPAPIQYEMLFLLAAIYFTLLWIRSRRALHIFAAGLSVGLIAVFKQNVGVYAAIALGLSIILTTSALPRSFREAKQVYIASWKQGLSAHIAAALGFLLPVVALVIYLASSGALAAAVRVFVQGPGQHIQMKLTGYPLPKYALAISIAVLLALAFASWLSKRFPNLKKFIVGLVLLGALAGAMVVPQAAIDNSIFWFAPALFIAALWLYARSSCNESSPYRAGQVERGQLLVLLTFAMASYGELFPRSVRGLVIGTMPPAFILLAFLFTKSKEIKTPSRAFSSKVFAALSSERRFAFVVISSLLFVFALRLVLPRYFYFDSARWMKFKAETELSFDRGRGIYLPAARAAEVNATVDLIRERVEEGGYFFAHALDATSFYFLANRKSPTGATLWNDAGTNDAERARTMNALREKQVRLVLTNEQAIQAEHYEPLAEYLKNDFHSTVTIGKTIFLERNY